MLDEITKFLGQLLIFGGGPTAVAYLFFQFLGKTWLENKFSERLEQFRHQQALEHQRLKVEIEAMLSGAIKLQEKEFEVLPTAWSKLDESFGLIASLVTRFRQYTDLKRMSASQLEEFLAETKFRESHKQDVRTAVDKNAIYQNILDWYRIHEAKLVFNEFQIYVARNGIFLPPELESKFKAIADQLMFAVISKEVGHEAGDFKIQIEGWDKLKGEAEPLYLDIKAHIQGRLHSHANK